MRVGIVGAGIGGLCTAIGLQRAGANVTVFERADELRPGGSGLSVFANGVRALDALGVGDQFRSITSAETRELRGGQRRPDGTWLATIPSGAVTELRVVDRADLHRLLSSALEPGTVHLAARVTAATPDGVLHIREAGGRERIEHFDVVVAADGLRSAIRAGWRSDPGVRYAGYAAWRAITSTPADLSGEAGETWGTGLRFGIAPLADGRVYWFAVATMPEHEQVEDEFARVQQLFGGWHAPIPRLLDATAPDAVHRLPINELAGRLPSFRQGRVLLLGDAAHAMTPNLGQGGGQAMEDAATLAALLRTLAPQPTPDRTELETALTRYDRLRRPRTQKIAQRSRAIGTLTHRYGPGVSAIRDLVVRLTPSAALARQLQSIQNWNPPS
ncbi:2-polyprenyl-6-methoxyphenol hydroxylase-like FAD-dependent oxidoreductase [Rhodococcus sp. LBL1]|nr:2-polyprenyl-6-methoxyphenol hydroxylase-like FAD-dependent oxidoreductase [Rhodococcus sp. LBL1]MDH6683428.1 2-polyprenyl-6-methoxyphenol hydroxylase-like FAD-dependent oxidoreductase [Rhodococcus sp. LBL2]